MITRVTKHYGADAAPDTVETLFVGTTLALHWNSTRVMSDVWESLPYATVLDPADGAVKVVWRGTGPAEVDATPEALAAANVWLLAAAAKARKNRWDIRVGDAVSAAKSVAKGKTVVVVKGRKVPKGTTGEVFWIGEGDFGFRAGLKDAAGTVHWTANSNLEVVNPDEYFDYDEFVTNAPDFVADAKAALNAPEIAGRRYSKYAEVMLSAGEDRIGFSSWFTAAALAAAAA